MLRQAHLNRYTAADAEGINSLISLIGSIYAVVFAFVIFVIWGQFTGVEEAAQRECTLLNDLLRFAQYLDPDTFRAVRRTVADYAHKVANSEWHSLGERRKDKPAEQSFAVLINTVVRSTPANPADQLSHQRLIDIARKLAEQRDERIAGSLTRITPTLLLLVRTMVVALLLLIFTYPFHSWVVGAACFSTVAIVLFFSNLVMTDTDNPFDGVFNVSPQPFADLA
jgi:AcrR family transcriptional regulator